ncbi:MAG: twin transmembrane helix small protein [Parvibaculum sp.]|uniref:twin transmembrane helix small protein n=1 Tax=Parvibaculum sp. TaxID=2024848 RepID=UPI001D1ADACB|nr:twin transmembrane helix small protein [Parvibaculum sp.]MBX3489412.1 twin transmembrane helix small protein [Parvibaculum sp.]MBX3495533.1 twin transmembrane helix small protein [Parvibaculum sp.]MCW5726632.1 twin transmembrane helix small protein [Parvibaculum sp.]
MSEFVVTWLAPIALIAVLAVLLAGLWNMMRGGSANRSQLLMRWRVGLQFLAVIVIMLGLYLANR